MRDEALALRSRCAALALGLAACGGAEYARTPAAAAPAGGRRFNAAMTGRQPVRQEGRHAADGERRRLGLARPG